MTRGQGIQTKHRFRWAQQPNGNYTIFSVPVFKTTTLEKSGQIYEFDINSLKNFVINFQNYRDKGVYPRCQLGHHSAGTENLDGAGYLDFPELRGEILYFDIIEIPAAIFEKIQQGGLPNRSVEIPEPFDRITNLALLESREPYFDDLPQLFLEEQPTPLMFQKRKEMIRLEKDEEKKAVDEKASLDMQDEAPPTEAPPAAAPPTEGQMPQEQVPQWAQAILIGVRQMFTFIAEIRESLGLGEEEAEGESAQEEETPQPEQAPAPVAMQKNEFLQMQKDMKLTQAEMRIRSKVASMSLPAPEEAVQKALQFAKAGSEALAMTYLADLEKLTPQRESGHRAQEKAFLSFAADTKIEEDEYTPLRMQAFQDYFDTMNSKDESAIRAMKRVASSPKEYIEKRILFEKVKKGNLLEV